MEASELRSLIAYELVDGRRICRECRQRCSWMFARHSTHLASRRFGNASAASMERSYRSRSASGWGTAGEMIVVVRRNGHVEATPIATRNKVGVLHRIQTHTREGGQYLYRLAATRFITSI